MKLKLISDGTPKGTSVVDEEGREIEDIEEVSWFLGRGEKESRLVITLVGVDAEALGGLAMLGLREAMGSPDEQ
jgi:hypothetical protein